MLIASYFILRYISFRRPDEHGHTLEKTIFPDESDYIRASKMWFFEQKSRTVDVEISSFDGLKLKGRVIKSDAGSSRVVIHFHGYHANGTREFSPFARFFHKLGYNILIVEQRAHSTSEGKYITFGVRERFDVRSWVRFAIDYFGADSNICLHGVSMGAGTILAASALDLPKNVKGIIADCGYTSPLDELKYNFRHFYHVPIFPLLYLADMLSGMICGWNFDAAAPERAVTVTKLPILFICGDKDDYVPLFMTKANYEACNSPKELVVIKNANHAQSYYVDPATYEAAVTDFTDRYLPQ